MADDQKQNIQTPKLQAKSGGPQKAIPDQGNLLNFAQPVKRPSKAQAGFPQWLAKENAKPGPKSALQDPASQKAVKAQRPDQPQKPSRPGQPPRQALGSKGNYPNDPKVIAKSAKRSHVELKGLNPGERYPTRRMAGQAKNELTKALTKLQKDRKSGKKKTRLEGWQQEQLKGAKVYKLTAYTTTDNINKRFRSIKRQSILRKILVTLIIILLMACFIGQYLDLSDTSELQMIVGDQFEKDK